MENQERKTVQMWNSDTKSFETWYWDDCEFCGHLVDYKTGECPKYKCWI